MPARRKSTPSYLLHQQSGRGRAIWTDTLGVRRYKLLPGPYDSPESRTAFARLLLELEAAPHHTHAGEPGGLTMAELLLAFMGHADRHYRGPDGKPTSEIYECKIVVRAVRELYGEMPVAEFGPLALKSARQKWVNEGRARTECNRRVGMVKRIFKWAVAEELAPPAVYQAVAAVTGLQRGRTAAREKEPVGPVDDAVVDATIPFLNRHVRGLVEFQRLTGCRPGEACMVRRCDIDTGCAIWRYKPHRHKNAWRGQSRTIAIGPRAQEVLKEFFTPNLDDYLFSPTRAVEELLAERSAKRRTPRFPSHMAHNAARRKSCPKRTPSEKYDRGSYGLAIDRACDRAFPPPGELAQREDETRATWWERLFYPDLPFRAAVLPGVRELRLAKGSRPDRRLDPALDLAAREGWAHVEMPRASVLQADHEAVALLTDLVGRLFDRSPKVRCERQPVPVPLGQGQVAVGVSHNDQKDFLRAALDGRGLRGVVVETANKLQGLEFEVVFVWHPLSGLPEADEFHLDPGRLCVLLTRHRQACVVVGRAGDRDLLDDRPPPPTAAYLGHDPDPVLDGWEIHREVFAALERFRMGV